jgi:hypothetical protein
MQPPSSPPPDNTNITNAFNDNGRRGGAGLAHNGQNNPRPCEATQGDAQTLCHPILNGKACIHTFLYYFQQSSLGMPCDSSGSYLPSGTPPPPYTPPGGDGAAHNDWDPFYNRAQFEIADFLYKRNQMPGTQIDILFDLWAASGDDGTEPPFAGHNNLYKTIDSIQLGDLPWICFTVKYSGPLPDGEVPTWMTTEYEVWCRDVRLLMRSQLANPDFDGEIDYSPLQTFGPTGKREWSNVMTGNWTWKQAVSDFNNYVSCVSTYAHFQDVIAEDPQTHGGLFVPVILGSDKTTVSVATGQNEYYPLYRSIGNVHNTVRHAHRGALGLVGFLSIPKSKCAFLPFQLLGLMNYVKKRTENLKMIPNFANSAANSFTHHYKQFLNPYDLA